MNEMKDTQIESMIRGHLQRELDGHVGAASRRFAEHIAASGASPAMKLASAQPIRRSGSNGGSSGPRFGSFWSIGLVGTALAATLTIVSMRHVTRLPGTPSTLSPVPRGGDSPGVTPVSYDGQGNVAWRTIDQGIVRLPDGTPARRYLQKRTDSIVLTDPKTKRKVEYSRPREQTVYVGLTQN